MFRSLLFVPGNRPDLMAKAAGSGADALILDLEDAVPPTAKDDARRAVAACLDNRPSGPALFVRVNPFTSGWLAQDLAVILPFAPDGLVLPKAEGGDDLRRFVDLLHGQRARILPIVTETARAIFTTGSYGGITPDLHGLTWGAEDLSAAIGATLTRDEGGTYRAPYELARSLCLFGAHAAGVEAIETVYPAFRDMDGLRRYVTRAREDGFTGMMAIHPAQVPLINEGFQPSLDALADAQAIVALFAANPAAGALAYKGAMVDAPHLARARRLLERAARVGNRA